MFKFTKNFAAVALAATSVAAFAQDMNANRSDLFNQEPSANTSMQMMGEAMSLSAQQRRLSITNQAGGQAAAAMRNGALSGMTGDQEHQGMSPDAENGNARHLEWNNRPARIEKKPSEFQKFVADNTGKILPIF